VKATTEACLSCLYRSGCTEQPHCSEKSWKLDQGVILEELERMIGGATNAE